MGGGGILAPLIICRIHVHVLYAICTHAVASDVPRISKVVAVFNGHTQICKPVKWCLSRVGHIPTYMFVDGMHSLATGERSLQEVTSDLDHPQLYRLPSLLMR